MSEPNTIWAKLGQAVGSFFQYPMLLATVVSFMLLFVKLVNPERTVSWLTVATPVLIVLGLFVASLAFLIALGVGASIAGLLIAHSQQPKTFDADEYSAEAEQVLTDAARRTAQKQSPIVVPFLKTD